MKSQRKFEEMASKRGWRILRRGWPDYLVILPDGRMRIVEVKGRDALRPDQIAMLAALERAGLDVEVWAATVERFMPWQEHISFHRQLERDRLREVQRRRRGSVPRRRPRVDPVLGV